MKQIIHIDKTTIKKNADAGATVSHFPGRKSIYFEVNELPEDFIDGENCIVEEWTYKNGKLKNVKGQIIKSDLATKYYKSSKLKVLLYTRDYDEVYHMPIPLYSFAYVNELLICSQCGKKFHLNELGDEEFWDGESDYYIEDVCPHCHAANCVEIEYEKIEDCI